MFGSPRAADFAGSPPKAVRLAAEPPEAAQRAPARESNQES